MPLVALGCLIGLTKIRPSDGDARPVPSPLHQRSLVPRTSRDSMEKNKVFFQPTTILKTILYYF